MSSSPSKQLVSAGAVSIPTSTVASTSWEVLPPQPRSLTAATRTTKLRTVVSVAESDPGEENHCATQRIPISPARRGVIGWPQMANLPPKQLRWDRIIMALVLLAGVGVGVFLLATR